MDKLLELAKKFVNRVEASPTTWQSGYPELAQEFREAIEVAEQNTHIKHCDFCGVDTFNDEFGRCAVCRNRRH